MYVGETPTLRLGTCVALPPKTLSWCPGLGRRLTGKAPYSCGSRPAHSVYTEWVPLGPEGMLRVQQGSCLKHSGVRHTPDPFQGFGLQHAAGAEGRQEPGTAGPPSGAGGLLGEYSPFRADL